MFLHIDELKTVANPSLVAKLTLDDAYITNQIIDESIALMHGYLSRYYDADAIFAAIGDRRNMAVVKRLKDIVIYEIYNRNGRELSDTIRQRYDDAIAWLQALNDGSYADASLPPVAVNPEEAATSGPTRFGGRTHYETIY